ncbi:transposase [Streptomyces sp. SID2955]|nr:transposase [Streptomyces sp. SID2955]
MAYAGTLVDWAESFLRLTIKPVSRPRDAKGFVVLPRRWVVERSLAWLLHARRNAGLRDAAAALRGDAHLLGHHPEAPRSPGSPSTPIPRCTA